MTGIIKHQIIHQFSQVSIAKKAFQEQRDFLVKASRIRMPPNVSSKSRPDSFVRSYEKSFIRNNRELFHFSCLRLRFHLIGHSLTGIIFLSHKPS